MAINHFFVDLDIFWITVSLEELTTSELYLLSRDSQINISENLIVSIMPGSQVTQFPALNIEDSLFIYLAPVEP